MSADYNARLQIMLTYLLSYLLISHELWNCMISLGNPFFARTLNKKSTQANSGDIRVDMPIFAKKSCYVAQSYIISGKLYKKIQSCYRPLIKSDIFRTEWHRNDFTDQTFMFIVPYSDYSVIASLTRDLFATAVAYRPLMSGHLVLGYLVLLLGPFCGAIAVPSVTHCRCCRRRRCRGHRCAGGVRQ